MDEHFPLLSFHRSLSSLLVPIVLLLLMVDRVSPSSLSELSASLDGEQVPLSRFDGKLRLIVNVASACGYTASNYAQLNQLYDKYASKGLEVSTLCSCNRS